MGLDITARNDKGEEFDFRAGSYSGYNAWREELASLAGYTPEEAWSGKIEAAPFLELVNFSDCEGERDQHISKKLAADFAAFQEKADSHYDEYFRAKYADWRRAFELASENGRVEFH